MSLTTYSFVMSPVRETAEEFVVGKNAPDTAPLRPIAEYGQRLAILPLYF